MTSCCDSITGWAGSLTHSRCWCRGDRTVFALTADHGVQPFPEMTGKGGRLSLKPLADRFAQEYQARYRIPLNTTWDLGLITTDVAALRLRGVNVDSLAEAMAREVQAMPGVARVFTPRSLGRAVAADEQARLWRRAIPPSQGWLVAATSRPGWIWTDTPGVDQSWLDAAPRHARPDDLHGPGADAATGVPEGDDRGYRPDVRCAGGRAAHRECHRPGAHRSCAAPSMSDFPSLPCFPCPHDSACCAYGATVSEQEVAAIVARARRGQGVPYALG